jgi:hypothetical protein
VIVPGLEAPHQVDARPGHRALSVLSEPRAAMPRAQHASEVSEP